MRDDIKKIADAAAGLGGTVHVTISVPVSDASGPKEITVEAASPIPDAERVTHAPDYSSVNWYGKRFFFTGKQRVIVAALFQAREEGYEAVSQDSLLAVADSDSRRLRDLFKKHPAWGTMIVSAVMHRGPIDFFQLVPKSTF